MLTVLGRRAMQVICLVDCTVMCIVCWGALERVMRLDTKPDFRGKETFPLFQQYPSTGMEVHRVIVATSSACVLCLRVTVWVRAYICLCVSFVCARVLLKIDPVTAQYDRQSPTKQVSREPDLVPKYTALRVSKVLSKSPRFNVSFFARPLALHLP